MRYVISPCKGNLSIPGLSRSIYFHDEKIEHLCRKDIRTKSSWPCQGGFILDVYLSANSFIVLAMPSF